MSKRFGNRRLNMDGDVNPMDGLINLSDIMLVLSCGLLLALIANWNIDIAGNASELQQGQEVSGDMQGLDDNGEGTVDLNQYEQIGVVFKDPVTGKLYMVSPDD